MKALMLEVDPALLEQRHRSGLDRWDEMWEGVLHMVPAPSYEHQDLLDGLIAFLRPLVKRRQRGIVVSGINIFGESSKGDDYRIPDLTFVARGRESIVKSDGVRGGGPDAVFEVRSPQDESYEKLPFFAKLGVREIVIIHRDTKRPEVHRLAGAGYALAAADADGWLVVESLRVRLRLAKASPAVLEIQDLDDADSRAEI
jgi:Uma2 family endonuclease